MDALKLIEKTAQRLNFQSLTSVIQLRYRLTFVKVREKEFRCLKAL